MAAGIDAGAGGHPFKTYHPNGGHSSAEWLQDEPWLDMNMTQSGHGSGPDVPIWDWVTHDLALEPAKPVLDGEPNYEDHPVKPWPKWDPANGYYRDHDVRKQLYRSVFAGACGVTYGHHSMWQFYDPAKRELVNHADRSWQAALDRPGAWQAGYLHRLMLSRPYLARIPDQTILGYAPQGRHEHMRALRDAEGRYSDGLHADLPAGDRAHGCSARRRGARLVVQPPHGRRQRDRHIPDSGRADLHPAGRRAGLGVGGG